MQTRPLVQLDYGRINAPIQIPNGDLLKGNVPQTFLNVNTASGGTSLTVKNSSGFSASLYPFLIIGDIGNQGTELVSTTAISNISTITCSTTSFPHSAGTPVYGIQYDKVQLLTAATTTGAKTVLTTVSLTPDLSTTIYSDLTTTSGYYFAFFLSSLTKSTTLVRSGTTATATATAHGFLTGDIIYIAGANQSDYNGVFTITKTGADTFTFTVANSPTTPATGTITSAHASPYSDPAPVDGYSIYSARSIIDSALGEINKTTDDVLTDQFAFQMLDAFQTDVLKEQKRWSFMQEFDTIIGQFNEGEWEIDLPSNIDDSNTVKSIYNIRVGANGNLTWIDKEKFNNFVFNTAYSTLAVALVASDLTMTLTDSGDFNQDEGTVIIGGNSYDYTANDIATGVLTLDTIIDTDNDAPLGSSVFQNANQGLPQYFTIFDGKIRYWPVTSSEYNGMNAYLDFYTKQLRITKDSDEIVVPDADAASAYLQWKFLKKLANGDETPGSQSAMQNYIRRREVLKTKASKNRTFKMNPRFQNFAQMEQYGSGDPRYIRDGAFENTGF